MNVKETYPRESGIYVCATTRGALTLHYSARWKMWNVYDADSEASAYENNMNDMVLWWTK